MILHFRYFSEIKRSTLDQLIEIYKLDFELFDYDFKKYYAYVIPDGTEMEMTTHNSGPIQELIHN